MEQCDRHSKQELLDQALKKIPATNPVSGAVIGAVFASRRGRVIGPSFENIPGGNCVAEEVSSLHRGNRTEDVATSKIHVPTVGP